MFARTPLSRSRTAAQHALRSSRTPANSTANLSKKRTFVTEALHGLSEGFLDLALAIPYPEYIPAYTGTIVLATVLSRLLFTVPFSVWAKQRQWRGEEVVVPELAKERPKVIQQVIQDMRKEGFRGDQAQASAECSKRAQVLMKVRQKELFKKYHCSPYVTMAIAPITQLPVFVATSLTFATAAQHPTVLDSESFFTLTSLAHSDPTLTLPIMVGILTLANVESAQWFAAPEAQARAKKVEKWVDERRAKGEVVLQPRRIFNASMRTLAVCRILITAVVPGAVQVYWVTSATFGLIQSWVFDWIHRRRRRSRPVVLPPQTEKPTVSAEQVSTLVFRERRNPRNTVAKPEQSRN